MGGCFVSFDGYRLRKIVIDPTGRQTVEQAWDVVRSLLPETADGELLEGADLGEMCLYLTPSRVEDAHAQLAGRYAAALVRHFMDEPQRYEELYWAHVWREDPDWLEQMIRDLMQFFAAARRDAVMP